MSPSWIHVFIGSAVLLFGRRLFWLFVAGSGFAAGAALAATFFHGQPDWVGLAIAGAAGVIGALVALFAQKVAIGIAGCLAGGYLGTILAPSLPGNLAPWIPMVIGSIVGALLLGLIFNWALIALSSLVGATLATAGLAPSLAPPAPAILWVALVCVGLALQTRQLRGKSRSTEPSRDR